MTGLGEGNCFCSYLPVHLGGGAHDCGQVGGHASASQTLVDEAQTLIVLILGCAGDGEVETLCAVELGVNQTRGQDAAAKINDLIGREMQLIESLLVLEDLAGQRVDPQILFNQTGAPDEAAVGEFGDARSTGSGCFARHGGDDDDDDEYG